MTFIGRPDFWLARRSRANASSSLIPSLAIRIPFARLEQGRRLELHLGELGVAGLGGDERGDHVLPAEGLREVAEDAGVDRAGNKLLLPERGQHHDRQRAPLEDPARRLDAVEVGHLDVHHDQVRAQAFRQPDRLGAVAGLADHLVPGPVDQRDEVHPDDGLVLGDEHSHGALQRTVASVPGSAEVKSSEPPRSSRASAPAIFSPSEACGSNASGSPGP